MHIKKISTKKYGTNCYLLSNAATAIVIDPAEQDERLIAFCKENRDKEQKLILLTHCHFDHIEAVADVKAIWNCPLLIGEDEAEGLLDNRINLSGYWSDTAVSLTPDMTLSDGDVIECGEDSIKVLSTPGHTAGSVCYLLDDILFSGDTLFYRSVGRTDLPTSDRIRLGMSLKRLTKLEGNPRVMPGHGPNTDIESEVDYNPYLS